MRSVVLISAGPEHSKRYRCAHAAEQLNGLSIPAAVFHPAQERAILRASASAGAVVLHRVPHAPWVDRVVRSVRAAGGLALFDLDDNILDPAAALHPAQLERLDGFQRALYREEIRLYRRCAERCDGLLVATGPLLALGETLGRPAILHRNGFSERMRTLSAAAPPKPDGAPRVLGYASGTPTHDRDLRWLKPVLLDVLSRRPDVELWLVGPVRDGGWGAVEPRVRRLPLVDWTALPGLLARFDVNLAPLDPSNPFNASKSELKFLEAALVGVPTVAPAASAFAEAIRHGETGWLAGSRDEWAAGLDALLGDGGVRRRLGEAARTDVLTRCAPDVRGEHLVDSLDALARRLRVGPLGPTRRAWTPASGAGLVPSLGEKARHAIGRRGWLALAMQAASRCGARIGGRGG